MASQQLVHVDHSTNTEPVNVSYPNDHAETLSTSSFWHVRCRNIFKIIGAFLVPLSIGIATLVISMQQTQQNRENRLIDIDIAEQARKQDAFLADQSEQERIVATYFQDISTLLLEKNVTFDKFSVASAIVRAKTLAVLRQLNATRKRQIILFLYETKLIMRTSEHPPISLEGAELDYLNMSLPKSKEKSHAMYNVIQLQLHGVSLINSSFMYRHLDSSDFSQTDLTNADLSWTSLPSVDFCYALLHKTDFTNATVGKAIFAYANLTDSTISDEQLSATLTFQGAILPNGTTAPLKNLVINGDAEQRCSKNSVISPLGWTPKSGSIAAVLRPLNEAETNNKCYFSSLSSDNVSIMHQNVDLRDYSKWIMNKQAHYCLNVTLSGIEYGKHEIIVNFRQISSTGMILGKVTICSHSIHSEYCDSSSLLYQEPYFTLYRDLYSDGKTDTQSIDIEIIFKKQTDNQVALTPDNVVSSCDNIGFYVYLYL